MRITKEKAAQNRARMVAAAAKLFRQEGLEGVGIDAVAAEAGLTHGAVYSHFKSKDALAAAAVSHALSESMSEWTALTQGMNAPSAFEKLLKVYVSRLHRDEPGAGCSIALLGSAAQRSSAPLQQVFKQGVETMIGIVAMGGDKPLSGEQRVDAIANAATMVGALVLSRATIADRDLSDEILKAVRTKLLAQA
jgi:TetR/AcrR family transcriptional repressor of nem operon